MKFYGAEIQKIKGKMLFLLVSTKTFHIIGVVKHVQDKHLFQREEHFLKSYNINVISWGFIEKCYTSLHFYIYNNLLITLGTFVCSNVEWIFIFGFSFQCIVLSIFYFITQKIKTPLDSPAKNFVKKKTVCSDMALAEKSFKLDKTYNYHYHYH